MASSLLLAVACFSAAPSAFAGDIATAEHLFKEGISAMKRAEASGKVDDYRVACDAFAGSVEADPSVGAYMNLGLCSEKQGKLASAWSAYSEAANIALKKNPPETERAQTAQADATRLSTKLQKLIVTFKGPKPAGAAVTRDGIAVPNAALEVGTPVDPGEHTIEVTAKGKKPWTSKVTVAAGTGNARIEIPALEDAPADALPPPAGGGAGDYRPPAGSSSDGSGQRTVGIVVGGVGILALLAAGGVQILAQNEASERDKNRDEATNLSNAQAQGATPDPRIAALNESADSHNKAAKNNQLIAIVTGAGGIVMLGVGAVLYFTAPKSHASGKSRFVPLLAPGFAGAGFGGTF